MSGNQATPVPDPGKAADPFDVIEKDLARLMQENGRLKSRLDESTEKRDEEIKNFLKHLLDVSDAFQRRYDEYVRIGDDLQDETKSWIKGYHAIYTQLLATLKQFGVEPIEVAAGELLKTEWHLVVDVAERKDLADDTIIEEVKRGYRWQGRLLRPAEVIVVRNG